MATQRIQLKRDTSTNWMVANTVLRAGEIGIETDTLKAKFGDGTNGWNSLGYAFGGASGGDMLKSENLAGLSDYTVARATLGLNTTANQMDSADKRFMTDAQEAKVDALSGINTGDEPSASLTVEGVVELATISETNTGTDTTRALTPDGLAGSNFGIKYVATSLNGTTALTTSDKAYFRIPSAFTGMNLVSVQATVGTGASGSSSSGIPTFTVKNVTDSNQMLSTSLTVDASEYTSATAATAAVINTSFDDVVTDDLIEVACTVAGTGVTYTTITLGFQLP